MFDWNDLRAFLAVAETGSTLAAGKRLRVSQTTAARRVAALEEALGVTLFDRRQSGYVLTPAMTARAVDGVVVLPIRFGRVETVDLEKPDWPKSHARPRYLVDDASIPFATISAFQEADTLRATPALEPPYGASRQKDGGLVVTWFQRDRVDPATWWLTYTISHPPPPFGRAPVEATGTVAVARYRLGEVDGVPVVRLALLCERPVEECDALRAFLMKGLPFAKARR